MSTLRFDELYSKLNPAQREAVDTIEGPVMVIAGPGTGKTQILTLRIANIVRKTDTPPDAILALTFTESGAHAMRKRLLEIMGSGAYRVTISTFHGFCNEVIQKYPEEFPHIIGSVPALPVDQIRILEEIIERATLTRLKPYGDPFYYLRGALSAISELKRENISPDLFDVRVLESEKVFRSRDDAYHTKGAHKGKMKGEAQDQLKQVEKNQELAVIYRRYQEELRAQSLYDYDDMIMEVIRVLESNADLLLRLQEAHQYILADEHQDANAAQNRLLELLSNFHENPNLFIVGDEKQAIFRFQGASLENFLYFKRLYPEARRIDLTENYRSSQGVLDSAHSLIGKAKGDASLRVQLRANAPFAPEPVHVVSLATREEESRYVAEEIALRAKAGTPYEEVAVLFRDNKDAESIALELARVGIPYGIESDENILLDPMIQKLVLVLRAVDSYGDEELLAQLLHADFLQLPELDIFKLLSYARRERRHLLSSMTSVHELEAAGVADPAVFATLARNLGDWHRRSRNIHVLQLIEEIVEQSGLLEYLLARPGVLEAFQKIAGLFTEAEAHIEAHRVPTLADFVKHLDLLDTHSLSIKRRRDSAFRGVRLMTAHRSKGLEFEYVYILGVYDGHWGNRKSRELFKLPYAGAENEDDMAGDDERRLLYVAITRAKKLATLTYPRAGGDGRELLPAVFIEEIDAQNRTMEDRPPRVSTPEDAARRFAPRPRPLGNEGDKAFLNQLFFDQGLSVTALNNYLTCPWNYFYTNLIRIPKAKDKFALYGTAVHSALKEFFDAWRSDEDLTKDQLVERFEAHLLRTPLGAKDLVEAQERGAKALSGYYDTYRADWPRRIENEFAIKGILFDEKIPLRGALDKIEFVGSGNEVNVVDYKTSKPKTRNQIMGETKTSTGDQHRQLVFYKLLLDRYDPVRFRMVTGQIDFIEPDDKGRYHTERFEITGEQVEELETVIRHVAEEIVELSFWGTRCGDKDCRYCMLRDMSSAQ